jgi:hypothetical protein
MFIVSVSVVMCVDRCSDMSLMLWDTLQENPLIQKFDHHSEFVIGLDFNMFIEGQMASCCKCTAFNTFSLLLQLGMIPCMSLDSSDSCDAMHW